MKKRSVSKESLPWWKSGVIYQIYPRSFRDSNGDGIGDLQGIINSLDYLQHLGVDALWLSPIFPSPMYDFGYDISDYRDIDPVFGNLADARKLIKEAHKRDIRIVFDMVMNHTSHLHPWFKESRSSKSSSKRDWYLWHSGKNGKVPNNWMAAFGGRAWEWDEPTGEYYYHAFLKEQPDLNWRNPRVRRAIFDTFRYWMDLGVDGFRLDVVNYYVKDQQWRSNPFTIGPSPRPYDLQKHLHDRNQPELYDYLQELRQVTDEYRDIMMVGETYTDPPGDPAFAAACMGDGTDMLHLAFDFSLLFRKGWNARIMNRVLENWYRAQPGKGWPTLVMSNHDQSRTASRIRCTTTTGGRAKVAGALLMLAKGTPFIYYGEELGMVNGNLSKEHIQDPAGIKYWPFFKGRDPYRTPMQWDASGHAGFTTGTPWLPVNDDYRERNVENQVKNSTSVLNSFRDLVELRKRYSSLIGGEYIPVISDQKDVLAFYRSTGDETTAVFLNFSEQNRKITTSDHAEWENIYSTSSGEKLFRGFNLTLSPHEILVLKRREGQTS